MNRRLDSLEHSHRDAEGNIQTLSNHLADLSSRSTATDNRVRQTEDKMKLDEQTVRDLAARVALLPTAEDLASVRRDLNEKVCLLSSMCYGLIIAYRFSMVVTNAFYFVFVSDP